MFIALNIHQCHQCHLHMAFSVRKEKFEEIAQELSILTPELISSVAQHLEGEGKVSNLSEPQKKVLTLLKEVNTVSEKILGSSACKLTAQNEIRAYMGYFGLPHIFMTINPNASHSPLFQLMYGDETVDLSEHFPNLVNSREYAIHLASDPVAGADFFQFSADCIFQDLFGWDYSKDVSTDKGGILGHLRAFYGTTELTERVQLHGHFLIWLDGGLNPSDVHQKMKESSEWTEKYFTYWEDVIYHHVPEAEGDVPKDFEPQTNTTTPQSRSSQLYL